MRDETKLYKKYYLMKKECPSCLKITHNILDCPLINVLPTYETVSLKLLSSSRQYRSYFKRKKKKEKRLFLNSAKFLNFSKLCQEEIQLMKSMIFL